MFIRKKKVKGIDYYYLVENTYNKGKKQSRQRVLKYLGKKRPSPTELSRIIEEVKVETKLNDINKPKITSEPIVGREEDSSREAWGQSVYETSDGIVLW